MPTLASDRTASRTVVLPTPSIVISSDSMGMRELIGHCPEEI